MRDLSKCTELISHYCNNYYKRGKPEGLSEYSDPRYGLNRPGIESYQ